MTKWKTVTIELSDNLIITHGIVKLSDNSLNNREFSDNSDNSMITGEIVRKIRPPPICAGLEKFQSAETRYLFIYN